MKLLKRALERDPEVHVETGEHLCNPGRPKRVAGGLRHPPGPANLCIAQPLRVVLPSGEDGEDAVQRIVERGETFDCLLLDENMARMNGSQGEETTIQRSKCLPVVTPSGVMPPGLHERLVTFATRTIDRSSVSPPAATRIIRCHEAKSAPSTGVGKRVPIVAVTANSLPADRLRFSESGMDALIVKPVKATAVMGEIRHFLAAQRAEIERLSSLPVQLSGRLSLEYCREESAELRRTDSAVARLNQAKRVGALEFWPIRASLGGGSSGSAGDSVATDAAEPEATTDAGRATATAPQCGAANLARAERRASLPLILESSMRL